MRSRCTPAPFARTASSSRVSKGRRPAGTAARPYLYLLAVAVYFPIGLYADAHVGTVVQQDLIGITTLAFLVGALRFSPPAERRQVCILVCLATLAECFCSLVWGVYRYRFGSSGYIWDWGRLTLENWQSDIMGNAATLILSAYLLYRDSGLSRNDDDEIEQALQRIQRAVEQRPRPNRTAPAAQPPLPGDSA